MHVDTGHNFPEVIEFRDRRVAELGERLHRGQRAGLDRRGPRRRGDRAARVAQSPADHDAARRHRRARLRRGHRRRAPRRGAGAREGAHLSLPRRVRRLGPEEPAARAVEPLQRRDPQGRARPRLPAVATGPSSTSGSTSREEDLELPSIYFAHEREVFARDGMLYAHRRSCRSSPRRAALRRERPLPHGRRHALHRRRRARPRAHARRGHRRDRRDAVTERGATRADDRFTEAAMEDRKREGYF